MNQNVLKISQFLSISHIGNKSIRNTQNINDVFHIFSLSYLVLNYLEDPQHNDFTEIEGDSEPLLELRKELIDLVSILKLSKLPLKNFSGANSNKY